MEEILITDWERVALDCCVGAFFSGFAIVAIVTHYNNCSLIMNLLVSHLKCLRKTKQNSNNCHNLHNVIINIELQLDLWWYINDFNHFSQKHYFSWRYSHDLGLRNSMNFNLFMMIFYGDKAHSRVFCFV